MENSGFSLLFIVSIPLPCFYSRLRPGTVVIKTQILNITTNFPLHWILWLGIHRVQVLLFLIYSQDYCIILFIVLRVYRLVTRMDWNKRKKCLCVLGVFVFAYPKHIRTGRGSRINKQESLNLVKWYDFVRSFKRPSRLGFSDQTNILGFVLSWVNSTDLCIRFLLCI